MLPEHCTCFDKDIVTLVVGGPHFNGEPQNGPTQQLTLPYASTDRVATILTHTLILLLCIMHNPYIIIMHHNLQQDYNTAQISHDMGW